MICTVQYCAKVTQANWENFIFCSWNFHAKVQMIIYGFFRENSVEVRVILSQIFASEVS